MRVLLGLVAWLYSSLSADELDALRTWTSQEGTHLRATRIDSDPTTQTSRMRSEDGRIVTIPWSRLSTADQTRLRTQAAARPVNPQLTKTAQTSPAQFECKHVPMVTQKENFCVPASAAMIAGFHGIKTDQDQIAQLSSAGSASNKGTAPRDMLLAMSKLGFDGHSIFWKDKAQFDKNTLPTIRRALVNTGPIYISFRPGVFGESAHGCVITGYNDRRKEMFFHNPWGNQFKKDYSEVAVQGYGIVFIKPRKATPIASDAFIAKIQQSVPRFDGDFTSLTKRLNKPGQTANLVWCSRHDARDNERFAIDSARDDGRNILDLSFKRNAAVLIPYSPDGKTEKYYFVTRPPKGGASYMVREITEQGWGDPTLKPLGRLTREWATRLIMKKNTAPIWELPMIELSETK
jgi:hypothetical protein